MLSKELMVELVWDLLGGITSWKLGALKYYPTQELGKKVIVELIGEDGWDRLVKDFLVKNTCNPLAHTMRSVASKQMIGEWIDEHIQVS